MTETAPDAPAVIHFEQTECGRCFGTGRYGPSSIAGGRCFQCKGEGKLLSRRGRTARDRYDALVAERLGRRVWELRPGDVVWGHYSTWAGYTPVDSPKAWRKVAAVEWAEDTGTHVYHRADRTEEVKTCTGRVVYVTPKGKTERANGMSAPRESFETWLFPVYDRDALVAIMREIARKYTGAWMEGEEPPVRAVRKPRAPKPAEEPQERQEAAEAPVKPLPANLYPGDCRACGVLVAAGEGERLKVDGRWAVQHPAGQCPTPPAAEEPQDAAQEPQGAPAPAQERPASPNRFGGRCADCSVWVEEGAGRRVRRDGVWVTLHAEGACVPDATVKITEEGMYRVPGDGLLGGGVFRVRRSERSGRLYAERFEPPAVKGGGATFAYDPAAVYALEAAHRMSVEDAAEIGRRLHVCSQCGDRLTDPRSVKQGIGPVCRKKV